MANQTSSMDIRWDTNLHEVDWRHHWNSAVLTSLLNNPSTHDVTFKTSDGGSVSAHKAILAASSPVFYDTLYLGPNQHPGSLTEFYSVDVDAVTLLKLLTFIYTGKVMVNSTCLDKMLHAACYFKLISLERILMKFAEKSLSVDNIVSVAILATDRNCEQLQKCCQRFIGANISEVARHPNFMALPYAVILEVCKSSDFNVDVNEIDLFMAVAEWYKHQTLSKTAANRIFQEIRYPLISKDDLMDKVKPTKLASVRLYTAALEYHHNPGKYDGPSKQVEQRTSKLKGPAKQHPTVTESVSSTGIV